MHCADVNKCLVSVGDIGGADRDCLLSEIGCVVALAFETSIALPKGTATATRFRREGVIYRSGAGIERANVAGAATVLMWCDGMLIRIAVLHASSLPAG